MDTKQISQLAELIPTEVKLYAGDGQPTTNPHTIQNRFIENVAHALIDPAFGWKYATAFAASKLPLPSSVFSFSIRRAWDYVMMGHCCEDLRDALILREEPMKLKRALLEALLIIPTLTLGLIAELTGVSVAAVKIFTELWFDVRDRMNDVCFIANIVYPQTRQVELQADYWKTVTPEQLLLRAAHNTDSVEVVLELFGEVSTRARVPVKELKKLIRYNLLAEATFIIQLGGCHQELPILTRVVKLITADIKAAARVTASPQAWQPAIATSPVLEWSVLEAVRAVLVEQHTTSRFQKRHQNEKVQNSSQRSLASSSSQSSLESQIPVTILECQTTVWFGATNRVRSTNSEVLPDNGSNVPVEDTLRVADHRPCLTECPVVTV